MVRSTCTPFSTHSRTTPTIWPLAAGLGGLLGDGVLGLLAGLFEFAHLPAATAVAGGLLGIVALVALNIALGVTPAEYAAAAQGLAGLALRSRRRAPTAKAPRPTRRAQVAKRLAVPVEAEDAPFGLDDEGPVPPPVVAGVSKPKASKREVRENQKAFDFVQPDGFAMPELAMLAKPKARQTTFDEESLRQNARLLEGVLAEFGVRGQIDQIRPGPVVTLYELVPAPGVKTARVVALADDIARSMSVASARVAVAQGFVRLGVGEIVSYVLPGNHGSRRVVEKAGFACERPFMHARRQHLLYRLKACAWSTASQPRARPRAEAMLQTA